MAATNQAGAGDVAASQAEPTGDPLPSWREGATKQAIQDYVQRVTTDGGPDTVPPEERGGGTRRGVPVRTGLEIIQSG